MRAESTSVSGGGAWTNAKILLAVAIGLFILSRSYMLFFLRPKISDVGMYFGYAANAVDLQQTPYTEKFIVPYPPLAYWTTCAPRLLDKRRITSGQDPKIGEIYFDYERGFRGLMFLCDLTSFTMLLLIARKRRPQMAAWAALLYIITTSILGHVLYDRLDVALLMLLMLGLYCWTRSLGESSRSIAWATLAYMIFGLGISFKIIPILCLPFFLLADFHTPRRFIRLALAIIVLTATISVIDQIANEIAPSTLLAVGATWAGPEKIWSTA